MNETTVRVRGIVFAHGAMADGLLDALLGIAGSAAEDLVAVSNRGRGPEELERIVDDVAGEGPVIVFTDLQSGSCATAARLSCHERGGRVVICGVNLPMLLDFVFHRTLPLEELVPRLLGKARDAVRTFPEPAVPESAVPGSAVEGEEP